ncbi:MAG: HAD-IA family hydrolase [Lachnospiraceae bacterium]|nr:HAD-IA family hydrolase [Lachnospiraceae bacterium]
MNSNKEAEKPYDNTESVFERLVVKGYRLGVIANQSLGTKDRLSSWGLLKYFDVVLAPAEEGVSKPDSEMFHRALAKAKCLPIHASFSS